MHKYLKAIKLVLCLWFFLLLVACNDTESVNGGGSRSISGQNIGQNILLISDIHFNPYTGCSADVTPCPSLRSLIKTPIEQWPNFLSRTPINNYGEETNNAFLTHGFDNLKDIIANKRVKVILITGDLLAHEFDESYYKFTTGKSQTDLTKFSSKTLLYVLQELRKRLPADSKIYLALGNHDTDLGNYSMQSAAFLNSVGIYLSGFIDSSKKTSFIASFSKGGYFSVPLSNNISLISLNTNPISSTKTNESVATEQLTWLNNELINAKKNNKKVIVFQHIPYGVDFYYTSAHNKVISALNFDLQTRYLNLLKQYSSIITTVYAGHYHREYLSLINATTPLIGTIAFNSYVKNNPGFKIIGISSDGSFNGYTTYYSTLGNGSTLTWRPLYDYKAVYGNPAEIASTLNSFPYDINGAKAMSYRQYYSGMVASASSISNDTKWKYYYCGIKYVESMAYIKCLKQY